MGVDAAQALVFAHQPDHQRGLFAEVVVPAVQLNVVDGAGVLAGDEVEPCAGVTGVRHRVTVQYGLGVGVDQRRIHVGFALERLLLWIRRLHSARRRRIAAARIEYSVSLASGRHVIRDYVPADRPAALVGCEEEILGFVFVVQAWNPERPAQNVTEIVESQFTFGAAGRIQEEVVGVQFVVAEEFVNAAVEIPGAGFSDHIDHTARHLSELGAEVVAQHLEFLQRIERRRHHVAGIGADIHIVLTIDEPQVGVALAAVDGHVGIAIQARPTAHAPVFRDDAGNQIHELAEHAPVQLHGLRLSGSNQIRNLAGLGLQLRGGRGDFHCFSNRADLQVHSEVQSIVDVQPDITGLIPLEASALYGELVVPYREIVQKKHARGRSLRDALRSGARIRGGHTGPRDNGPGGIGNGT